MQHKYPMHIVAVGAFVRNDKNQLLLVRSPKRGWEFPGGQVEEGESLFEAVQREVMEEAGVVIKVIRMVGVYSNIKPPTKLIIDFEAEYLSGELRTSEESLEVKWVNFENAQIEIKTSAYKARLSNYLENDKTISYMAYHNNPFEIKIEQRV